MIFDRTSFDRYLSAHRERFLRELAELVAIPSVTAQKRGIQECADAVQKRLEAVGARVQQIPTPNNGSPVVFAEIGQGKRTLLIYDHYDVQPEDPVELWDSSPFEVRQENGVLYGRGIADNKGDLMSRIQALETWQQTQGDLPLKIKFVVEGEEEIGSVNLHGWVDENKHLLDADGVLWEGANYDEDGTYRVAQGCKGIAYLELRTRRGPAYDLHSSRAPMVENPAWRLVWALSTLKDTNDNITLDGYADHLYKFEDSIYNQVDHLPFEGDKKRELWGLDRWVNDMDDATARRRYFFEPTLTICGLESGYTGTGAKTIIPSHAMVKLDFRLVPHLTPELVQDLLRKHLDRRGFQDIEIINLGGENPSMLQVGDTAIKRAALEAYQQGLGLVPVVEPWMRGSGPIYALSDHINVPVICAGTLWHPNSRAHAPNENILEKDYFDNMRLVAALIAAFAANA